MYRSLIGKEKSGIGRLACLASRETDVICRNLMTMLTSSSLYAAVR